MRLPSAPTPGSLEIDTGFGDWLEFSYPERIAILLCEIAVAYVASERDQQQVQGALLTFREILQGPGGISGAEADRYMDALASNSNQWRDILRSLTQGMPQERRDLIGLACTTRFLVNDEYPETGSGLRRADAVLDILDVDSNASEIQSALDGILEEIVGSTSTSDRVRDLAQKARSGAEVLTMFHPFVGLPAQWGLARLGREPDAGDLGSAQDLSQVLALGRVVMFLRYIVDEVQRNELAASVRDRMWDQALALGWTGAELRDQGSGTLNQVKELWAGLKQARTGPEGAESAQRTGLEDNPAALIARSLVHAAGLINSLSDEPVDGPTLATD